ncbi:hypothetical protein QQ045_014291 [Rhodiola kirilowii]
MSETNSLPLQLCVLCLLLVHGISQKLYVDERSVLHELKEFWQSPPSIVHWKNSTNHCTTWPEITCTDNSVTGISLQDRIITNFFVGLIPDDIDLLKNLQQLNLGANNFSEIGNLANLMVLEMAFNKVLPVELPDNFMKLGKLKRLWSVDARDKPEWSNEYCQKKMGNLVDLEYLNLAVNNLSGYFQGVCFC